MRRLTFTTAGESHGPALVAVVTGLPAGMRIDTDFLSAELRRRQGGYGRGGRQRIEQDEARILAGVRQGRTLGSPVALEIVNRDSRLDDPAKTPPVHRPRPGHADLAGSVKWLTADCRGALERASARETAARVAAGCLATMLLRELEMEVFGFVRSIHDVESDVTVDETTWKGLMGRRDASSVYCPDKAATVRMEEAIRAAKTDKDTVGGLCEAHVFGAPIGLGSCVDWRDKLDARLAQAVMSIQAFKAVEIGLGKEAARRRGSQVHDPILFDSALVRTACVGFTRSSNNAGGTEGGMTNGQPIVVRGAMKPISTLLRGLPSVNLLTKQPEQSQYERSDVCAVSAASVVMQHAVAMEVASAALEKFGGDSLLETVENRQRFLELARTLPLDPPVGTIA